MNDSDKMRKKMPSLLLFLPIENDIRKKKEKDKIIRNLKETQIESSHIQKSIQIN